MASNQMQRSNRTVRSVKNALIFAFITVAVLVAVLPLIWVFLMSFKLPDEWYSLTWIPANPSLDNYLAVLGMLPPTSYTLYTIQIYEDIYVKPVLNSLTVALGNTALSVGTGVLAAYGIDRYKIGGKNIMFWILSQRMAPPIAFAIPLYIVIRTLGLLDTTYSLMVIYSTFNVPFAIWMMKGFFEVVPTELDDAAMADGCSRFQAFIRVVLPLCLPGIAATAIFCFLFSWNEFLYAVLFTSSNARTVPVLIAAWGMSEIKGIQWGTMSSMLTLTMAPVIIFALLVQRYIVAGLTFGAVKG